MADARLPRQDPCLGRWSPAPPQHPYPASETPAHPLAQPRTLTKFLLGAYRNPRKGRVWGQEKGLESPHGQRCGP